MNAPLPAKIMDLPIFQMDRARALSVLKSSLFPGAADESVEMVLGWCEARGVDPMDKPCHIVPMWDKVAEKMRDVIMPSVDYYRQKAESTGEYIGLSDTEYGPAKTLQIGEFAIDYPEWARIVVKRLVQGRVAEFLAKVYWLETYATAKRDTKVPNAMWKKRPIGQLEKCAEALALRRAFPKLCGGPTAEEMSGKVIDNDTIIEGEITGRSVEHPRSTTESAAPAATPASPTPPSSQAGTGGAAPDQGTTFKPMIDGQKKMLRARLKNSGLTEVDLDAHFKKKLEATDTTGFAFADFDGVQKWIAENAKG